MIEIKEGTPICPQCEQLMENQPRPDDWGQDGILPGEAHWICRDCHAGYVFFTMGTVDAPEKTMQETP